MLMACDLMLEEHEEEAEGDESTGKVNQREGKKEPAQGTSPMEALYEITIPGENGSGGKPVKKNNPFVEIDLVDPNDPIKFQGLLQKYKPGFNQNFIDRWVIVTEKSLRYYTSKPISFQAFVKPLMAIPLSAIKEIEWVTMNIQFKKKDVKTPVLAGNTFEIYLKEEFLDLYLRTDYESLFCQDLKRKNEMLKNIEKAEKNFHSPQKKSLKEKFVMEEHDNPDVPLSHAAMHSLNTHSGAWSNRAGMWPLSDRRLVFTTRKPEVAEEWLHRLRHAFDPEKFRDEELKEILEENEKN